MIGQTIAHYKILSKLGQGGMGEVYLAGDTKLDRQVALKFLPRHFSADPDARSRFEREAKALAALNHPNIVSVYDVSEHEGQPFIAMEFIEGRTIKSLVADGHRGIDQSLRIIAQAADGLAAAHKRNIVHRDIKSENMIISPEERVKIMDFGLATWQGVTRVTAEGSTLGTRAYMSPEQSAGQNVDYRTDLWSLGVVLYELITERLPFAGYHDSAIAYAIANETPEPLARYKADCPDELQRIVSKCLAKDPALRYQSAADLAADLRALTTATGVDAAGVPRPVRRPRWQGVATMALIGVIGVLAFWFIRGDRTTGPVSPEDFEKTLVVLPFENLGSQDDEYFADGITDEITARLAGIGGLRVISRTSAVQFKGSEKSHRDVGKELGVNYILEGTIRWDKSGDTSRVRITPQLIQVQGGFSVWSEIYERAMTRIFAVQSDIARHIANELNVALEGGAQQGSPTDDLGAYDYYLRGKEYMRNEPTEADVRTAVSLFEKAIALDSDFAEPYAGIGIAVFSKLWFVTGDVDRRDLSAQALQIIEQALILAPALPSAHLAKGYYYNWAKQDYDLALAEFSRALELGGKDSETYHAIAWVQMRQGKWSAAEESLHNALRHDPLSVDILGTLAELYITLRRFDDGMAMAERALSIAPDKSEPYLRKAVLLMSRDADTAGAAAVIRGAIAQLNTIKFMGFGHFPISFSGGFWRWKFADISVAQVRASYLNTTVPGDWINKLYGLGVVFDQNGQKDSALVYYDSLIAILQENIQTAPEVFDHWSRLGLISMLAGYKEEAVLAAKTGVEKMTTESCHW